MMNQNDSPHSAICKDAAHRFGSLEQAFQFALQQWRQHPAREEWLETLEEKAIRSTISDFRHHHNTGIRKAAGEFDGKPQVTVGRVASQIAQIVYLDWKIGGRTIRSVLGKELANLADKESEAEEGHAINRRVLQELDGIVPADKHVGDCVNESQMRRIFQNAQKQRQRRSKKTRAA